MAKFLAALTIAWFSVALSATRISAQEESYEGFMNGVRANMVKGKAAYQRKDGMFDLEAGLKLEKGDSIKTANNAYAELLLQPGNYLRLGSNTDLEILDDEHDRMKLKLHQGVVNLEILTRDNPMSFFGGIDLHELIRVITPDSEVFITEGGIFRIDASREGRTELIARNGSAYIDGKEVKKKRRAVVSNHDVSITDIDPKNEDAFDTWNRERAGTLIQANKLLKKESPWAKKRKEGQEASVDFPNQDDERNSSDASPYVVSAKPGTVSFTEDGVEFNRAESEWEPLTEKSQLDTGDKLRTGEYSFAELMLFPDMYLRIGKASEITFEELSNDGVVLRLSRGSAILEVASFNRKQLPKITIAGSSISADLADSGNFRIDAGEKSEAITVRKGKVSFNTRSVGSCRVIAAGGISDCDKDRRDSLDSWSNFRGEGLIYSFRSQNVAMASFLARTRQRRFRNAGFWFQNPGQPSYTFVPFTSELFHSPYGGSYSTVLSPRRSINRIDTGSRPMRYPDSQIARPIP